jgi:alpha-tubulin suppressor-like RCC1 family protein
MRVPGEVRVCPPLAGRRHLRAKVLWALHVTVVGCGRTDLDDPQRSAAASLSGRSSLGGTVAGDISHVAGGTTAAEGAPVAAGGTTAAAGGSGGFSGAVSTVPCAARTSEMDNGARLVAVGDYFACALGSGGLLKCWGMNSYGNLGLGDSKHRGGNPGEMGNSLPAVDLGVGRHVTSVALGSYYACALLDDGSVKCWGGEPGEGELGLGDRTSRGSKPGDMGDNLPTVDLGVGRRAKSIAIGYIHTCVLLEGGAVKCWGHNYYGQLGIGDTGFRGSRPGQMGDNLPTVDLGTGRTATRIAAGESHNCALLDDSSVKCWGSNYYGELGIGDTMLRGDSGSEMGDYLPTVDLGTGRRATSIAASDNTTCALLDDGSVKCWGALGMQFIGSIDNRGDQPGEMGNNLPTVDFGTGYRAVSITAGRGVCCALLDDGSVKCRTGIAVSSNTQSPATFDNLRALDLGSARCATQVSFGSFHSCALLDDGAVKCWGYNSFGELGLGDTASRSSDKPSEMGDNLPAVDLAF